MRRRAITIYAENEEEFVNLMKKQDEVTLEEPLSPTTDQTGIKSKKRRRSRVSIMSEKLEEKLGLTDADEIEPGYDFLSLREDYQIGKKEQTLQELEKIEEEKLLLKIENMNKSFKNKNTEEFLSAVTDLSYLGDKRHSPYLITQQTPCKKQAKDSYIERKGDHSISSHSTDLSTANSSSTSNKNLNIIMQNLNISEVVLKLIILGDKAVGKTFLVDKICGNLNSNNDNYAYEYKPTQCLEIKSFLHMVDKSTVKVELLDTNINILSSDIIKTYFKLSSGFILLCDIANLDSIKFVEKQVENIFNFSNNSISNLILFANIKNEVNMDEHFHNLEYLTQLEENFSIKANFVNLSEYLFAKDIRFKKFLQNCFERVKFAGKNFKSNKEIINLNNNLCNKFSKSNIPFERSKTDNEIYSRSSLINNLIGSSGSNSESSKKDKCLIF